MANRDRVVLEKVAKNYNKLMELQAEQRKTTAVYVRACVIRLRSKDPAKRAEAITALSSLADILERKQ